MHKLIEGDIFEVLAGLPQAKCLIADPPDNINLGYASYDDNLTTQDYETFLWNCIILFTKKAKITWISYNAKYSFLMGSLIHEFLKRNNHIEAKPFLQTYTFGTYNPYDCCSGFRPLVRLKHKDAAIYPKHILVPSWRQLHGDKRANIKGRVPSDTWCEFPRVVGNSKYRRKYSPTQLHPGLIERILKFSTQENDTIFDAFSGSGTVLDVCKKIGRQCTSIEIDPTYCMKIRERYPGV